MRISAVLKASGVAILFILIFLADGTFSSPISYIGFILRETSSVFRDSETQWMLILCLVIYFIIFSVFEWRVIDSTPHSVGKTSTLTSPQPSPLPAGAERERNQGRGGIRALFRCNTFNPNLWLAALVLLALLPYALAYGVASRSLQIPLLMTGIVFGKAIATWARWRSDEIEWHTVFLVGSLVCLLAASALWQPERATGFQYHGIIRWNGVWDNPNLYGLLMGVGLVLTAGLGWQRWKTEDGKWLKILSIVLCSFAAILCGIGLFKSYSRGAWLAVFAGLIYLTVQTIKSSPCFVWFRRNWLSLAFLAASLSLLAFWQFHFSESRPAQRIFSVANANDFSWRNRVTAWEGAARMMVDRPWTGFGWGQAETDYGKKYCPPRLIEGAAIEMNDYFMIGISAGVPALICFTAYLALSLRKKPASPSSILNPPFSIFTIARAGSIVLLVGFWFDGGLFKLPVAIVFWMLMELSRIESVTPLPVSPIQETTSNDLTGCMLVVPKRGAWENRLRWLAGILAVLAVAETTVYFGMPFLPICDGTLAVAQKCLIQRSEAEDFDFLSTNAVWRGQKLKVLLEHVRLANYNRQIINWKLEDKIYQDFVLSPVITGNSNEQLNWRRLLWEEFYLRIRHESSPEDAAKIVMKLLRERVAIVTLPNLPQDVPAIWLKQMTDEVGFEIIYVAALRSVGLPARLVSNSRAEFWDGNKWQTAPLPSVVSWP
jgi:O-antigen ligase